MMITLQEKSNTNKLRIQTKKKSQSKYPPNHSLLTQTSYQSQLNTNPIAKRLLSQVAQLKPFSIIDKQQGIEQKLNQIFLIHRRRSQNNKYQQKFPSPNKNKSLRQQFIHILQKNNKRKKTKMESHQLFRAKRSSDSYDDIQNQLASQLINQTKKQRKSFQTTIDRFHKLIEEAEIQYVNKNELDFTPKQIKQYGLKRIGNKDRVCTHYQEYYQTTDSTYINSILNKKDFHTWLRSSKKLVNNAQINEPLTIKPLKEIRRIVKNNNGLIYKRNLKKSIQRKSLLPSSPSSK